MKSIKPITAVLSILLLAGCAFMTTVKLQPTDTVRNATTTEKSGTTRFNVIQQPSAENPDLEIAVVQWVTREQTFQRRYVEKRVLKPGARPLLWLGGAALAAGGYLYFYQQGYVVLGRDLMGLGLIVPRGGTAIAKKEVGEQWKPGRRGLPPRTVPAANIPVVAAVGSESWTLTTDGEGRLVLDVASLIDMVEPGRPLTIDFVLQEDTTQRAAFTVAERPSIPSTEVEVAPTLAILDFEGLGISEQEAQVLTNRLGTHLVQLGRYQVIERGQMQQILREQDFQMTGCTSDECAVEIGQLLGVQRMLAGSFGKFGSIYTIDMRIIDVATGGILRTTSYDVQGEAERLLTEGLAEAARRIAGID